MNKFNKNEISKQYVNIINLITEQTNDIPQQVALELPKLKLPTLNKKKQELPKLKLPKLQKA